MNKLISAALLLSCCSCAFAQEPAVEPAPAVAEAAAQPEQQIAGDKIGIFEAFDSADRFDNSIASPLPKPDFERVFNELSFQLALSDKQAKNLKDLLLDYQEKFDSIIAKYNKAASSLNVHREELLKIRADINKLLSSVPDVIMQKLEPGQRDDYNALIAKYQQQKEDAAKAELAKKAAAEKPVVTEAPKPVVRKPRVRRKPKIKPVVAPAADAAAPSGPAMPAQPAQGPAAMPAPAPAPVQPAMPAPQSVQPAMPTGPQPVSGGQ